jgi:hypothetical protein
MSRVDQVVREATLKKGMKLEPQLPAEVEVMKPGSQASFRRYNKPSNAEGNQTLQRPPKPADEDDSLLRQLIKENERTEEEDSDARLKEMLKQSAEEDEDEILRQKLKASADEDEKAMTRPLNQVPVHTPASAKGYQQLTLRPNTLPQPVDLSRNTIRKDSDVKLINSTDKKIEYLEIGDEDESSFGFAPAKPELPDYLDIDNFSNEMVCFCRYIPLHLHPHHLDARGR